MKWHVLVNERMVEVDLAAVPDIHEVEPGVYSAIANGRSYLLRVAHVDSAHVVDVAGQRLIVDASDPHRAAPRRRGVREGRYNLTAAMPGKIVRVLVNSGDAVEAGQGIAVVEAMKMQNEVKAPRGGRVVSVRAIAGATVAAGDILATIDQE